MPGNGWPNGRIPALIAPVGSPHLIILAEAMNTRRIGTTELMVHEVGFGAMHLSIDIGRRPSHQESITLIRRAVDDLGIDFIDTADAYCNDDTETGHNERLIAEALRGERRQRVVIATKGGSTRPGGAWMRNGRPVHLRKACEASLRALETDRIDLYQHHAPDPHVPVEESLGALVDLQREGKIRHIGLSNYSVPLLQRAMKEGTFVSVQNQYSLINKRESEEEVITFCEEHGLTYIPWNPIGGRGKAPKLGEEHNVIDEIAHLHAVSPHAIAIAWLLGRSPAIIPIPGTRKFEHLAENIKGASLRLTSDEIDALNGL
jgi:aryl-alcohol dehydrogenase-like predicted oxidoreductase